MRISDTRYVRFHDPCNPDLDPVAMRLGLVQDILDGYLWPEFKDEMGLSRGEWVAVFRIVLRDYMVNHYPRYMGVQA